MGGTTYVGAAGVCGDESGWPKKERIIATVVPGEDKVMSTKLHRLGIRSNAATTLDSCQCRVAVSRAF